MSPARSAWLGALIVIVAASLFGSLGVMSRFAYAAGMEPFAFVTWRAAIGAIGLYALLAVVRGPGRLLADLRSTDPRSRRWLALGVAVSAGLNLAAFLAFDNTTVALALLGFYTYPAMVAAASVALGREPLDASRLVALVLALGGMTAVVLGGPAGGPASGATALGIGLALTAAACQTVFILTSRNYASIGADQAMGAILTGSALVAGAAALVVDGPAALAMPLGEPSLMLLLLFVGLFAAALPSVLFLTGIRWIGGVRTGILMLFEPVVGVALAAALLDERLEPIQALGGLTVLVAALLVQRGAAATPDTPAVAPAPGGP